MFTYDVCLLRKHISSKTLKKIKMLWEKMLKIPKNSIKEECGAKVAIRPFSMKILKCCKSNFKSVKMAYLPTSVKVCLSRLHGV